MGQPEFIYDYCLKRVYEIVEIIYQVFEKIKGFIRAKFIQNKNNEKMSGILLSLKIASTNNSYIRE